MTHTTNLPNEDPMLSFEDRKHIIYRGSLCYLPVVKFTNDPHPEIPNPRPSLEQARGCAKEVVHGLLGSSHPLWLAAHHHGKSDFENALLGEIERVGIEKANQGQMYVPPMR